MIRFVMYVLLIYSLAPTGTSVHALDGCVGYCASRDAPKRPVNSNVQTPNPVCIRILQPTPDAVVIQMYDKAGKQLRLKADGTEMDRWDRHVLVRDKGLVYRSREVFDGVHRAVICNGTRRIEVTRAMLDELLANKGGACQPLAKQSACLGDPAWCAQARKGGT